MKRDTGMPASCARAFSRRHSLSVNVTARWRRLSSLSLVIAFVLSRHRLYARSRAAAGGQPVTDKPPETALDRLRADLARRNDPPSRRWRRIRRPRTNRLPGPGKRRRPACGP